MLGQTKRPFVHCAAFDTLGSLRPNAQAEFLSKRCICQRSFSSMYDDWPQFIIRVEAESSLPKRCFCVDRAVRR